MTFLCNLIQSVNETRKFSNDLRKYIDFRKQWGDNTVKRKERPCEGMIPHTNLLLHEWCCIAIYNRVIVANLIELSPREGSRRCSIVHVLLLRPGCKFCFHFVFDGKSFLIELSVFRMWVPFVVQEVIDVANSCLCRKRCTWAASHTLHDS